MKYFLAKTDPDTYSVYQFEIEKKTIWDGVHNYQAINAIKEMSIGDEVFIYHSQTDKAIMAIARVIGRPYENKDDPRYSWAVEMEFVKMIQPIPLSLIKANENMKDFNLVKNPRLSTMLVPSEITRELKKLIK